MAALDNERAQNQGDRDELEQLAADYKEREAVYEVYPNLFIYL